MGPELFQRCPYVFPISSGRCTAAVFIRPHSQEQVRVVQYNNCGRLAFGPVSMSGGDVVHAAGVPGVATGETPHCEPASLDGTMYRHRFEGISRAGWKESAHLAVQGRDDPAVRLQQDDEDVAGQLPEKCSEDPRSDSKEADDGGAQLMHAVSLPLWCPGWAKQPAERIRRAVSWSPPRRSCNPSAVGPSLPSRPRAAPGQQQQDPCHAYSKTKHLLLSVSS